MDKTMTEAVIYEMWQSGQVGKSQTRKKGNSCVLQTDKSKCNAGLRLSKGIFANVHQANAVSDK